MKLAEAMKEKSRLKKEISDLRTKLEHAAQAGEAPEENPQKILLNLEETLRRMETLSAAIHNTGNRIRVEGKTLAHLIYSRDALFFRLELYKNLIRLAESAENPSPSKLDISELEAKAERARKRIRSLNDLIEKTNWAENLIE